MKGRHAKFSERSLCPAGGLTNSGNLYDHTIVERNRVQEQKLWGISPGQRGPKKPFLDRGSQGCRIISVSKEKAFAGRPDDGRVIRGNMASL